MTRFDPTLILRRMIIQRDDHVAYDEKFHSGVNVIRGENSSGKSTILNFIMYGLGGDLTDWSEAARLCTRVILEVELNGKSAVLSRQISMDRGQPMEIFGGDLEASKRAPRDEWIRYPYARSPSKESFSQALFRLVGYPEVANEISGNLTVHQVLRLLYADQLSPVESIFKLERVYDSPLIRDAVGRLLCGAYDGLLYENQLEIRNLEKEFESVNGELRSLFTVLGQVKQGMNREWLQGQQTVLEEQRGALAVAIAQAEQKLFTGRDADQLTLSAHEGVYKHVQELQMALGKARQDRDALALTIADSSEFVLSLQNKLKALNDSHLVAENIGDVRFQFCPACYSALESSDQISHVCHLCKTPFDQEGAKRRIVAIINDTAIQLKQSQLLQERRQERMAALDKTASEIERDWRVASQRLAELQRLPSTEAREHLRELHRKAGYLEREIEGLRDRAQIMDVIDQLSRQKEFLNGRITELKTQNDSLRMSQEDRLAKAYSAIADEIRTLLRNDLRRQDSFENPNSIEFDFSANRVSVDGQTYFSASSRVILKSSFFLGFLAAATKHPFFRHPRFIMIDTVEDKGMEPQRSHNFQNQILRVSEESKVEHQMIYATAMIAPDLDEPTFTVGKFSTRDDPTLNIG